MTYQLLEPQGHHSIEDGKLVGYYTAAQMLELRMKTIEEVIAMWEEPWGISQQSFSNRLRRLE